MREIKFRSYSHLTGIMYPNEHITAQSPIARMIFPYPEPTRPTTAENLVIMQYTGLKDANGKDIYEGDLVCVQSFKQVNAEVRFVEKDGCWALFHDSFKRTVTEYKRMTIKTLKETKAVVVGNIYRNHSLIGQ